MVRQPLVSGDNESRKARANGIEVDKILENEKMLKWEISKGKIHQ